MDRCRRPGSPIDPARNDSEGRPVSVVGRMVRSVRAVRPALASRAPRRRAEQARRPPDQRARDPRAAPGITSSWTTSRTAAGTSSLTGSGIAPLIAVVADDGLDDATVLISAYELDAEHDRAPGWIDRTPRRRRARSTARPCRPCHWAPVARATSVATTQVGSRSSATAVRSSRLGGVGACGVSGIRARRPRYRGARRWGSHVGSQ